MIIVMELYGMVSHCIVVNVLVKKQRLGCCIERDVACTFSYVNNNGVISLAKNGKVPNCLANTY
jgi:hypothetical protein